MFYNVFHTNNTKSETKCYVFPIFVLLEKQYLSFMSSMVIYMSARI